VDGDGPVWTAGAFRPGLRRTLGYAGRSIARPDDSDLSGRRPGRRPGRSGWLAGRRASWRTSWPKRELVCSTWTGDRECIYAAPKPFTAIPRGMQSPIGTYCDENCPRRAGRRIGPTRRLATGGQ